MAGMASVCSVFHDAIRPHDLSANQSYFAGDGFDGYWHWVIEAWQAASAHEYFAMDAVHGGRRFGIYGTCYSE